MLPLSYRGLNIKQKYYEIYSVFFPICIAVTCVEVVAPVRQHSYKRLHRTTPAERTLRGESNENLKKSSHHLVHKGEV
jgi:hypothetical protein